ncbi:methionine ABC transporter permease [Bartonella sp. LJL80]
MFSVVSKELPQAIFDTLIMTISSSLLALLIGLPIGLILYTTARESLFPSTIINRTLSAIVDSVRAIPFIILAFYLLPVTRVVVGTGVGIKSVIFVLTISAIPFYARMAELSFRGVDKGLVEAIRSMGASRLQIVSNVIVPESFSSLVTGFTVMVIAIISATSLAGFLGGGGLGDMAIRYGYQRYNTEIMTMVIVVLIILNVVVQWCGDRISHKMDRTKR